MLKRFQFIWLFITLFPVNISSECCYSSEFKFQLSDNDCCTDFGGARKWYSFFASSNICTIKICGNGKRSEGIYCGAGSCNIFGCNCDGGCISGDSKRNFKTLYKKTKYLKEIE